MSERHSVAIVGVGAMGEALASGLLSAGWGADDLSLCVRRMERADELAHRTGCQVTLDPVEAILADSTKRTARDQATIAAKVLAAQAA